MGQDVITRQQVLDAIKYANISMGIYLTQDDTDARLLLDYTHAAMLGLEATSEELKKALERVENTSVELPRSLSASFFKNAVLNLRSKTKENHQNREATRETTDEERREGVELYYQNYKTGGATWQHWSAGSAWIARYLQLDIEPFMEKAQRNVCQEVKDDGVAKGLRAFLENIGPNKIQNEAERMAVQAHFRKRLDAEL